MGRSVRAAALGLAGVVLGASLVGYLSVSFAVAERFTHAARYHVDRPPKVAASSYEDVQFRTSDGLTLRGWWFPVGNDRAAIVVHGKDGNRISGEERNGERLADVLIADGYSVLLFDMRGHGESDGDRFSLGHLERRDVDAAVGFVVGRGVREDRVALIGVSMGAGTVLQSLLVRPNVGPVVADSAYTDVRTLLDEKLEQQANVPSWFTPGVLLMANVAFGLDGDSARPIDVVRTHPERAFLFIHCQDDALVARHHAIDLREASANPQSELWMADRCQHAWAFNDHTTEYKVRLLRFLNAHLGDGLAQR